MSGIASRRYGFPVLLALIQISLLVVNVESCILLLNGWQPVSPGHRAVLADIVTRATVLRTFKQFRTEDTKTYTAEIQIERVYKGQAILDTYMSLSEDRHMGDDIDKHTTNRRSRSPEKYLTSVLGSVPERLTGIHNVSNLGDRALCYSDVTSQERYILFLAIFNQGLSAKYDDLFGAAVDFSQENENQVLQALGKKKYRLIFKSIQLWPNSFNIFPYVCCACYIHIVM